MKRCPACGTIYTDESLKYCLSDGTELIGAAADLATDETISMATGRPVRIDIPSRSGNPAPETFRPAPPSSGASGGIFKVLVVVLLLGLIAVIAIAAGTFIYFKTRGPEKASLDPNNVKTATPAPSPGKDDKDELRDQIANLEKMLNEQKRTNKPVNIPLTLPDQPATTTTVTVNSPSDGFLALRSLPSSEAGERVLKIPHGATVSIGACGPIVKPVSRAGHWCQASYNGYSGWVFDAYLDY